MFFVNIHKNIFACFFSAHNLVTLSCHEQVFLMRVHFERYFSYHWAIITSHYWPWWWEKYFSKRSRVKHTCSWRNKLILFFVNIWIDNVSVCWKLFLQKGSLLKNLLRRHIFKRLSQTEKVFQNFADWKDLNKTFIVLIFQNSFSEHLF